MLNALTYTTVIDLARNLLKFLICVIDEIVPVQWDPLAKKLWDNDLRFQYLSLKAVLTLILSQVLPDLERLKTTD